MLARAPTALFRLLLTLGWLAAGTAFAQEVPRGAIRLIVPFPSGGSADFTARILAPGLARVLGHQVVVENRPGASGLIGAEALARAAPDGLTLGISNAGPQGTVPFARATPPYDPVRGFSHIALLTEAPAVLVVRADSRFRNLGQLLLAGRTWFGGVSYATPGIASPQHLLATVLAETTGAQLLHVPYAGTGPALRDLLGGQPDALLSPLVGILPWLADGRLRALAVSAPTLVAALPGVPTFDSLGLGVLTMASWNGLSGPRGMAPEAVRAINAAAVRVLADPAVADRLRAVGLTLPAPLDAAGFTAFVAGFAERWGAVVVRERMRLE